MFFILTSYLFTKLINIFRASRENYWTNGKNVFNYKVSNENNRDKRSIKLLKIEIKSYLYMDIEINKIKYELVNF